MLPGGSIRVKWLLLQHLTLAKPAIFTDFSTELWIEFTCAPIAAEPTPEAPLPPRTTPLRSAPKARVRTRAGAPKSPRLPPAAAPSHAQSDPAPASRRSPPAVPASLRP